MTKFKNGLSADATDLADAVEALIAEAKNAEDEVTFDDLKKELEGLLNKEQVEEIVNDLHDKFKVELRNSFSAGGKSKGQAYLASKQATKDYLNSIVEAAQKSKKVSEVWGAKLIENDVTDWFILKRFLRRSNKWRDGTGLFSAIEKVHDSHLKSLILFKIEIIGYSAKGTRKENKNAYRNYS